MDTLLKTPQKGMMSIFDILNLLIKKILPTFLAILCVNILMLLLAIVLSGDGNNVYSPSFLGFCVFMSVIILLVRNGLDIFALITLQKETYLYNQLNELLAYKDELSHQVKKSLRKNEYVMVSFSPYNHCLLGAETIDQKMVKEWSPTTKPTSQSLSFILQAIIITTAFSWVATLILPGFIHWIIASFNGNYSLTTLVAPANKMALISGTTAFFVATMIIATKTHKDSFYSSLIINVFLSLIMSVFLSFMF